MDAQKNNELAFLSMLRFAEGTDQQADPYRVCYGYEHTIEQLNDHPSITGEWLGKRLPERMCKAAGISSGRCYSTAAGAYQIIKPTWQRLKQSLNLPDFSGSSQDAAALELIREAGALSHIHNGEIYQAIERCAPIWASLPGNTYQQGGKSHEALLRSYIQAGGFVDAI